MNEWFAKATLVDWIVVIGMCTGLVVRLWEWYDRSKKVIADSSTFVTKDHLKQALRLAKLEYNDELKHWVRGQLSEYVPEREAVEWRRRLERLEDKI